MYHYLRNTHNILLQSEKQLREYYTFYKFLENKLKFIFTI